VDISHDATTEAIVKISDIKMDSRASELSAVIPIQNKLPITIKIRINIAIFLNFIFRVLNAL
jgi:hypothetical protein